MRATTSVQPSESTLSRYPARDEQSADDQVICAGQLRTGQARGGNGRIGWPPRLKGGRSWCNKPGSRGGNHGYRGSMKEPSHGLEPGAPVADVEATDVCVEIPASGSASSQESPCAAGRSSKSTWTA